MRLLPIRLARAFAAATPPVQAGIYATIAAFFFAGMSALIRHAGTHMHPFEVVFFRNLVSLLIMLPWLLRMGFSGLHKDRIGMHALRATFSLGSMLCGFTAVTMIPLTQSTALSFAAPLFSTAGAALFLGETVRLRRWSAVLIGFAGTLVILRPDTAELNLGTYLALANAVLMGVGYLLVKSLSRTERPEEIVSYMVLLLTPMSLIPAVFVWTWPSLELLAALVALGAVGTVGHLFFTRAFAVADVTIAMPFDFFRLPFTALIAFFIFGEVPTIWTWVGGAVIFASTFYIARREAQLARARMLAAREEVSGVEAPEKRPEQAKAPA
jgi:drug/metabolite transporter (DMT)-like permease